MARLELGFDPKSPPDEPDQIVSGKMFAAPDAARKEIEYSRQIQARTGCPTKQKWLRRARAQLVTKIEKYLGEFYFRPPQAANELKRLLRDYKIDSEIAQRILWRVWVPFGEGTGKQ